MPDAKRFLDHAAECERMASRSSLAKDRETFLKMAADWRRMAEQAEDSARRRAPGPIHLKRG
jgi:hypothetical protein